MPETRHLFNKIAGHYDLLNTVFSLGIDRYWRKELYGEIRDKNLILDIATGTAEVAITISQYNSRIRIVGIDPSIGMLSIGKSKTKDLKSIVLVQGINESLPFKDSSFDGVTIAFGIRNTRDLLLSLEEIYRVLKPEGKLSVLEFTTPESFLFRPLFLFYSKKIMPFIGSMFGSRKEYEYLSESSQNFPQRQAFTSLLSQTGFRSTGYRELTLGIASIYHGYK